MTVPATRWHAVSDAAELAQRACARILEAARAAVAARGVFSIVLAGGGTPRATYALLRTARADWARWQVWFGDERCLPADSPERNSCMARATWLDHVPVPRQAVHVIDAELGAAAAAAAYARALHGADHFDCVLLGLGEDGHTASLFPGRDWGVGVHAPDVLAVHDAPKPPSERVSLSAARLVRARAVWFLVAGPSKQAAVTAWRSGAIIPAAAIRPAAGVDVLIERRLLPSAHTT